LCSQARRAGRCSAITVPPIDTPRSDARLGARACARPRDDASDAPGSRSDRDRARQLQDLVGPAQILDLALQILAILSSVLTMLNTGLHTTIRDPPCRVVQAFNQEKTYVEGLRSRSSKRIDYTAQFCTESPRVLRRLQLLRRWSHEEDEQVLA
jgi:hypothetical protein